MAQVSYSDTTCEGNSCMQIRPLSVQGENSFSAQSGDSEGAAAVNIEGKSNTNWLFISSETQR